MKKVSILVVCFLLIVLAVQMNKKDDRSEYSIEQKKQFKAMYETLLKDKLKDDQKEFMRKAISNYYELTPKRKNLIFVALKKNKKDMDKLDSLMSTLQKTLLIDKYELTEQEQQDLGYFTQNHVIEYLYALQSPVLYK